ncbi:hypothetical protein TNCV_3405171 [Trichonephila clavipes]|nr:hypothetical protein TNCV_3405171 [Trichonephila clavipes]
MSMSMCSYLSKSFSPSNWRRRFDFDQSRRVLLSSDAFYFRPDSTNGNQSTKYYEQLRREKQAFNRSP